MVPTWETLLTEYRSGVSVVRLRNCYEKRLDSLSSAGILSARQIISPARADHLGLCLLFLPMLGEAWRGYLPSDQGLGAVTRQSLELALEGVGGVLLRRKPKKDNSAKG